MQRLRTLAATVNLLLLCASASAQSYQIRITHNTNLRISNSLSSGITESAKAGSVLSVICRDGRWLKIDRHGRVVWMASWVDHERVAPAQGSQTPANVDNCCHVNRQCHTDQDWQDGYWAYQRNECPVGAATTGGASTQPVSGGGSAQTDNCCYLGWQCPNDDDWHRGYWAYQNGQCGGGASSNAGGRHGGLIIEGGDMFQIWVNAGLELLRSKAPHWYHYVIGATRKILELPPDKGGAVDVESATHVTGWDPHLYPNAHHIFSIAHELVHEACHIYQYWSKGWSFCDVPWRAEKECVERELEAMLVFDPQDEFGRHGHKRETIANIEHDPSIWWW